MPFFWVHDLAASLRFYVEGLGFRLTRQWVHEGKLRWCWLEREGAALMLQEFWREGPDANLPAGPVGLGVNICFICRDALALYREFQARGLSASRPFREQHVGDRADRP